MRLPYFDRLDRYAVRMMAAPLGIALAALLVAMLLERLLRLFDLAASSGVPLSSVFGAAGNLVPHYLGLAIPLAFTVAMFAAAARMSDDNEIDVMLALGRSVSRICAPYFVLAALLCVFNLYLFGQLQPITRYGYHVAIDQALNTAWDAKLEENRFIDAGRGFSFSADTVETADRRVHGVFIERRPPNAEEVTTATSGQLEVGSDARGPLLRLDEGSTVREAHDGEVLVTRFENSRVFDIVPALAPFRPRGDAVRERTLGELWADMQATGNPESAAEFHGRLTRALLPPLLPLLAMPLGMASKRGRRAPGVIFAGLALLTLNHALQFGESMASNGHLAAAPAVWTPYLLFGLLSGWIFFGSFAWPGDNPVSRGVGAVEAVFERLRPRRRAGRPR